MSVLGDIDVALKSYDDLAHNLKTFMTAVANYIGEHPSLNQPGREIVHSVKSRLKSRESLRAKLLRKQHEGALRSGENLTSLVTDLAGVRVLHLCQDYFSNIDAVVRTQISDCNWILSERPKAYTWDPEVVAFFHDHELDVSEKPSSYTSVHYLVRPFPTSPLCCEIQVRTLFEEIWGEIDHRVNYPQPTDSVACREQIKVLSKLVGAGSRLVDSLQRAHRVEQPDPRL